MYLKHIAIKNIGPISELNIKLPFAENGNPKPIIIVGENGTGKTIALSQIIDSFYEIASNLFTDIGKNDGLQRQYYKISGAVNLRSGCDSGFSLLQYENLQNEYIEYFDKTGRLKKEDFKNFIDSFNLAPNNENGNQKHISTLDQNIKEKLGQEWKRGVYFYQPAYRYEEPIWKNDIFKDETSFAGVLGKEIEIVSANNINKSYLLDLVLDKYLYNHDVDNVLWNSVNVLLKAIKGKECIRFGIGRRGEYRITIGKTNKDGEWEKELIPSIDALSLGESILLNLFINIIRHGDNPPKKLDDIIGIVVIDEIDIHLHTKLQSEILPRLIGLFPKVQFIIKTHSPLFILGMKRAFGKDGFEIRNMPDGEAITSERFSEFENAYNIMKETEKFDNDINQKIKDSHKPIIFVEGAYDIKYIEKASELFEKQELINKVTFIDADGYQNLNKIWQHKTNLFQAIPQKMLLLYDCDTKVANKTKDKIYQRIIPYMEENYFDRGIENLFPKEIIKKAIEHKKAFVDITAETKQTKRGVETIIPEKYDINLDEKGNLCDWLCENGTKEDFKNFDKVFKIIEEFLSDKSQ